MKTFFKMITSLCFLVTGALGVRADEVAIHQCYSQIEIPDVPRLRTVPGWDTIKESTSAQVTDLIETRNEDRSIKSVSFMFVYDSTDYKRAKKSVSEEFIITELGSRDAREFRGAGLSIKFLGCSKSKLSLELEKEVAASQPTTQPDSATTQPEQKAE